MTTADTPDTPGSDSEEPTAGSVLGSAWLAALLTAVVVGLAVFVGFKAYDALDSGREASAESSQALRGDERAELIKDAAVLSQRVLTYHHDRFDRDFKAASARLTPKFAKEYSAAMEKVRVNTGKNKISQEATAVSSSIITANHDEAQVLVFVNQETSSVRTKAKQLVRNRLVVDLVRVDGHWAIDGLNALG